MATKSTRKKPQFNKADIAKKLDEISTKVSQRGAHVVVNNGGLYAVLEALQKRIVLHSIPQKHLAETLCVRLNQPTSKGSRPTSTTMQKTQKYLLDYCDILNNSLFYKHTIKMTKDDFRREVAFVRLDEAVHKGKYILTKIKGML